MRKAPNKKEIPALVSIRCEKDKVCIEVEDACSNIVFLELELKPSDFVAALGRLSSVDAKGVVRGLTRIGKFHECKSFEFLMPPADNFHDEKIAWELAQRHCPKGWIPDHYFGSQNSFFQKDGEVWARTTCRRWVDEKGKQN